MKEYRFFGSSDDLFEVDGHANDEIYVDGIGCYSLVSGDRGLIVSGTFLENGCWSIGVSPMAEGEALPHWITRFEMADNGYSSRLVIRAPDDTECTVYDDRS